MLAAQTTNFRRGRLFLYLGSFQSQLVSAGCDWLLSNWLEIGGSLTFPKATQFIWCDSASWGCKASWLKIRILQNCTCMPAHLLACVKTTCLSIWLVHALQSCVFIIFKTVSIQSHLGYGSGMLWAFGLPRLRMYPAVAPYVPAFLSLFPWGTKMGGMHAQVSPWDRDQDSPRLYACLQEGGNYIVGEV